MPKAPIYLDHHATTPVDPRVWEAMEPYFMRIYGNPSSKSHRYGWMAAAALERAREQVAGLIGAHSDEIVFTSGATESINTALRSFFYEKDPTECHLVTSSIEHPAVLRVAEYLSAQGIGVSYLAPDEFGAVSVRKVHSHLEQVKKKYVLLSLTHAHHEVGTINSVSEIGELCKKRGVAFHVDAAQSVGKIRVDVRDMGADLVSFSAHKIYGPKGVGGLFVSKDRSFDLQPFILGGGQELEFRSGTENVPGIVGFGKACELAAAEMKTNTERVASLRDLLYSKLYDNRDGVVLNGHPVDRLPGNLNVSFTNFRSDQVLSETRGVAFSSGSACTSLTGETSGTLLLMGLGKERASSSVRFGLGKKNTEAEVESAADRVLQALDRLESVRPGLKTMGVDPFLESEKIKDNIQESFDRSERIFK